LSLGKRNFLHLKMSIIFSYKRLSENAKSPIRATPLSAGLDLYSAEDVILGPNSRKRVMTDLRVWLPPGCYGRIAPRSGLS
ncbi:hypothetical protein B4U79_05759, partial [Dinothrombium tinctorium]